MVNQNSLKSGPKHMLWEKMRVFLQRVPVMDLREIQEDGEKRENESNTEEGKNAP